jgi:hypothetical protein
VRGAERRRGTYWCFWFMSGNSSSGFLQGGQRTNNHRVPTEDAGLTAGLNRNVKASTISLCVEKWK